MYSATKPLNSLPHNPDYERPSEKCVFKTLWEKPYQGKKCNIRAKSKSSSANAFDLDWSNIVIW